jgi:hypothetical protein
MIKYGNDNHEKELKDGTILVSNVPITEEMEKGAGEVVKNAKKGEVETEIIKKEERVSTE